jgi:beta-glucosidase
VVSVSKLSFPDGFIWGTATASYQVEGAVTEGGRGPSSWDTFAHTEGRIKNGDLADVACDHYHRYPEDIALMAGLGLDAYRFSVAWPRVQPDGKGAVNADGLAFYDRLVDALLDRGIAPYATLYHWDLPQALEDEGGWLNRDTAERFAEYAGHVHAALGDRVSSWITLNEPFIATAYGYALGMHAPGKTLLGAAFPAAHHQLLGHGLCVSALRAGGATRLGITQNMAPTWAATDDPADQAAAAFLQALQNDTYSDPVLLGRYPENLDELHPGADLSMIRDGDLATIAAPIDFLGVNYYAPNQVKAPGPDNPLGFELVPFSGVEHTSFDWPVVPRAFTDLLVGLRERYGAALPPIYITENGAAFADQPDAGGRVADDRRIAYLDGHLRALRAAIDAGVDVRGYFCWSLLDNFEWAEGFSQRFGLVRVDFETQQRTPKASYDWYRELIAAHRAGQPGPGMGA